MIEMKQDKLIYRGSSKDVYESTLKGAVEFDFTDRYSVFDWGEMPDLLRGKGQALSEMAEVLFDALKKVGIDSHFIQRTAPTRLAVKRVAVHFPPKLTTGYDYQFYQAAPVQTLVPLEVLFRWGAPKGSSYLKRHPHLKEGTVFSEPVIEFTTKLETLDRELTWDQARELAGLTRVEFDLLIRKNRQMAQTLKDLFTHAGLVLWDGKTEWAFQTGEASNQRDFLLVDAIGLDELRVSCDGQVLSKEALRHFYRESEWFKNWTAIKTEAPAGSDYHQLYFAKYSQGPLPLPLSLREKMEHMYLQTTAQLKKALSI